MASASKIVEEVERETITLSLTEREAQLIAAIFAHTNDVDSEFPQVRSINMALRGVAPNYFGKVSLVENESGRKVIVRFKNV